MSISVVARGSPLSRAQVSEVQEMLKTIHPDSHFVCSYLDTTGDKDQHSSLMEMEKTNFFTKEIDEYLLSGKARIAIHSAKDLPDPLPKGLSLVALTRNISNRDILVLKAPLETLKPCARIGTSSMRRHVSIKSLLPDAECIDIRGTIEKRMKMIETGSLDGVVIAEAALLRLGLKVPYQIALEENLSPLQGRLAVVAREDDLEMAAFFAPMHKEILYLGSTPPSSFMYHYPLLTIKKRPVHNPLVEQCHSHIILTSKHAAEIFLSHCTKEMLAQKTIYAIGPTTAKVILEKGYIVHGIPDIACQEGMIAFLETLALEGSHFLLPRSSIARECIDTYLTERNIPFCVRALYDTIAEKKAHSPPWNHIDEIYFSSPSTVDACSRFFPDVFTNKEIRLTPIGPVTKKALEQSRNTIYEK